MSFLDRLEKNIKKREKAIEKEEGGEPGHWGSLTKAVVNKLEAAGYKTLEDLKGMNLKALEEIEGIGKVSAKKILKELA